MSTAPLVSIALATYNGRRHLAEQLESLLAQTHAPLELMACDDASTDDTWQILERYAPRFASARLIRNERNVGVSQTFQRALRACRAEWIAPCDQDDVWAPDKLERLLAASGDAALVYADSELIDAHGRPMNARVSDRLHMVSGSDSRMFALANCVSGHSMLLRRSLLDRALPVPEGAYYDWWIAFVAASAGSIRYVDAPLVRFRQHAHNASSFGGRHTRDKPSVAQAQAAQQHDLDALAGFDGPHRPFFERLATLWRSRTLRLFTPALAAFLFRHRDSVFASKRRSPGGARHALKYLWGLRWRS